MSFVFNSHTKFNSSLLFTQGEIQLIPLSHQDTLSLPQNIKGIPLGCLFYVYCGSGGN